MSAPYVPILCYHRILPKEDFDPKFRSLFVTPEQFGRQMNLLKILKYRPISIQDLIASLKKQKNIPGRSVVITFDDGYEDNYRFAFPILKKFSFPATIFLVTGSIGKVNFWDEGNSPLLNESQIDEMSDGGIYFGSHTESHIDMSRESREKIVAELQRSKKKIETLCSRTDIPFCYPYTRFTEESKKMVKECGYIGAVSGDRGRIDPNEDIFDLLRIQIFPSNNLFDFWRKLQPWYPKWLRYQTEKKRERPQKV